MTRSEFVEDHSGNPYVLSKVAKIALEVDDDCLITVAERFLEAQSEFEAHLETIGFKRGGFIIAGVTDSF